MSAIVCLTIVLYCDVVLYFLAGIASVEDLDEETKAEQGPMKEVGNAIIKFTSHLFKN